MSLILNVNVPHPTLPLPRVPHPQSVSSSSAANGHRIEEGLERTARQRARADTVEPSRFRLAQIRAVQEEISRGTYETPERIAGTVERLLDVLA